MKRPVIVFVGAVYPGQHGLMCEYLRREGLAETYFLTTTGYRASNCHLVPNLLAFKPDGKIVGPQSYYYSDKVERSARISRGILAALREVRKKKKIHAQNLRRLVAALRKNVRLRRQHVPKAKQNAAVVN